MTAANETETLALSCEEAATRAKAAREKKDPHKNTIAPSLLSAQDIEKYVLDTGLISPFYTGGGSKSRLKKASYEGRIGSKAYEYDRDGELRSILKPDEPLVVPANSIVFVESDLEFRLPIYIALRYNLQIRHVHRGLLLGTGPLVDPGYWGKLCIPLHNLTNEDYSIPVEEGLIWVEFTKTTSESDAGRLALSEGKEYREYWDIEPFLRKAARSLVGGPTVGIRSSIPTMVDFATDEAKEARKASSEALAASKSAAEAATEAQEKADQTLSLFNRIGYLGAVVAAIALVTLWGTFAVGMYSYYNSLDTRVDGIVNQINSSTKVNPVDSQIEDLAKNIDSISTHVRALEASQPATQQLEQLLDRINRAESEIRDLQQRADSTDVQSPPNTTSNDNLPTETPDAE